MKISLIKLILLLPLLNYLLISFAQATPHKFLTPRKYFEKKVQSAPKYYVAPRAVIKVAPKYTAEALSEGVEGRVILSLKINELGQVTSVRLLLGLGFGLDRVAKMAAFKWKFRPAMRAGVAVPGRKTIKIKFIIEGESISK